MTISLKNVAKRAGISVTTASLILNGRGQNYSQATQDAVLQAAKDLRYRPDRMASRNSKKQTRRDTIGFLLRSETPSHLGNTPAFEFLCGVNDVMLEKQQFLVMVKLSHLIDEAKQPRLISERFIDGLIIETGIPKHIEQAIDYYDIPAIWLNTLRHGPTDCVYPDEIHASFCATQHLLQLGHRNVIFVTHTMPPDANKIKDHLDTHYSLQDRQIGYEKAMTQAHLKPNVIYSPGDSVDHRQQVCQKIAATHQTKQPITAIVSHSFGGALNIREYMAQKGLNNPKHYALISVEDIHLYRRNWPQMTGMTCDRYEMGRRAAQMLLTKLDQHNAPQPSYCFKGTLITGSTALPLT